MKQMLEFDLRLLTHKKTYGIFLLISFLIYIAFGIYAFSSLPLPAIVASAIFSSMNAYALMINLCCHSLSNNINASNYSLCIYFPVKRNAYFTSKSIYAILSTALLCIITVAIALLSSVIDKVPLDWKIVNLQILGIVVSVAVISGAALLTCTSGRAFQIGTVVIFSLIGSVIGMLSASVTKHDGVVCCKKLVILYVSIAVTWLFVNALSRWIAKKVTV